MAMFIDVREPAEYEAGHVDGAVNIPVRMVNNLKNLLPEVSKDDEIILYCRTGSRASVAIQILRGYGYKNLANGINQKEVEKKYK